MARPTKKRKPKPRIKKWDSPKLNNNYETEEEDDGIVQNAKNKEIGDEMNQDMKQDTQAKEPMQCMANTQKYSGIVEHSDPA